MKASKKLSRRSLLKRSALAGTLLLSGRGVLGANEDLRVAIIGLGGKGKGHVGQFSKLDGVRIVALCDVDPKRLAEQSERVEKAYTHSDPRKILDRNDIDAVVIATPDHWHALLAVWACQSGRDVYVEKPVSHNILEGRRIVEAAEKYGRIVQSGTQYRSDAGLREAAAYLHEGHLGKLQWGHVVWYELRGSIGRVPAYTPAGLDYDLYCGPAAVKPLRRPKLHYDWHWVWSTGTGDLGNSGIHAFDTCRWMAGYQGLPPRAICVGGRFGVDDVAETPNTQLTLLDYPDAPITIENRNLPKQKGKRALDHYRQVKEGVILQYEGGYFAGLRAGGWTYDNDGKRIKQFVGDGGRDHARNFIQAVRARNAAQLNAPIQEGHISSACCHLGNLSYRLADPADVVTIRKDLGRWPQAAASVESLERHLAANEVDLKESPMLRGPWLDLEPDREAIAAVRGLTDRTGLAQARGIAEGSYRAPYVLPSTV